jgi:hypothetical protein
MSVYLLKEGKATKSLKVKIDASETCPSFYFDFYFDFASINFGSINKVDAIKATFTELLRLAHLR